MSEVKVNKISPRTNCGTVQLGDSGDTITIPAGATITNNGTQTGFGRTGTVDWQTGSIKTANFTASSGEGYFCNTSGGAFTVTLPASPSAGAIVAVADYAKTFDSNALTIGRNSQPVNGVAGDPVLSAEGQSVTLVYVDGTKGWLVVNDGAQSSAQAPAFVTATGGTITTSGDFKIHTFTSPGTFCVSCAGNAAGSNEVSYMVVAGGGGGGGPGNVRSGGGGAGGFREGKTPQTPYTASPLVTTGLSVTATGIPITVGGGGAIGASGSNSVFSTITSAGGGFGANNSLPSVNGQPGGSGGGSSSTGGACSSVVGGTGNTPPVSPPQGNNGGSNGGGGPSGQGDVNGGGGGAGEVGADGNPPGLASGRGGVGVTSEITGSPVAYAGGGGGGGRNGEVTAGAAGPCGTGGEGATNPSGQPVAGDTNTGGGGGGTTNAGNAGPAQDGGAGGSGIVVIRYKFQ